MNKYKKFIYIIILLFILNGCKKETPVQAIFSIERTTIYEHQSVSITNSSTGEPINYNWSAPGSTNHTGEATETSTDKKPTFFYIEKGDYEITLNVYNDGNQDEITKTITVLDDYELEGIIKDETYQIGETIELTGYKYNGVHSPFSDGMIYNFGLLNANSYYPDYEQIYCYIGYSQNTAKWDISSNISEGYYKLVFYKPMTLYSFWGYSEPFYIGTASGETPITSPSSSSDWETGNSYDIQWGDISATSVKLELYNNSSFEETITSSTSNDGNYNWSVPSSLSSGSNYQIKITNTSNSSDSYFSDNFTLHSPPNYGSFTDTRDNQIYSTIIIGSQTWMAENLNYYISDYSFCYDENSSNCGIYGKLYETYNITIDICPAGWHLPTDTEFETLFDYVTDDDDNEDLKALVATGTSYWETPNLATNTTGFSILPGGQKGTYAGYFETFYYLGTDATFAVDRNSGDYYISIGKDEYGDFSRHGSMGDMDRTNSFSVRCLKD